MGVYFTISGIIILFIFLVTFFSKDRVDNTETKKYQFLLILTLITCILDVFSYALLQLKVDVNGIFYTFIAKTVFICFFYWGVGFASYAYAISKKSIFKFNKKLIDVFVIFITLLNYFLPVEFISSGDIIVPNGIGVMLVYIFSAIFLLISFILALENLRYIMFKKYAPIFLIILLLGISIVIQNIMPDLFLINYCLTIVIVIMYFTIENPDVKMLNEVSAARDAADKANRAKSDFLSSMSHEIRTPLNAIVGFSECIKNSETLEEAKENALDIVTASESLLEIVNGILDISKIESGKLELVQSDYDIYKILDEVVKLIKGRLGDKPLSFEVNIAPDLPHVLYGDHFNIKKVLINFLTNAVKYTDEGFVKFDVKCVKVNNDVCRLIMSVKDSGRGIKKENIDKLFTKFQRLDEDKNTTIEGTGLGLAITKQLVEMMHGKIVVNSVYGTGSEFTVAIDQRISKVVLEDVEEISDEAIDLTGRKILIVDDNKLNLKVALKLLEPYKCTCETSESGFGCIDKITSGNKYDIILLDDMMPKMRGSETLTRLKTDPKFDIPVIALTANAIQGMREQYILLGFDDYLAKPIEKGELNRVLKKFVLKDEEEKTIINEEKTIEEPKVEEIVYKDYSGVNVLIVDDNKLNVKVASKIMNSYNFNIDAVYSGLECLDKVKEKEYDLIFMDYMMPNMDGIETFNKLKEIKDFNVPVIALTADAVVGAKDKFINAGFQDYVAKPIDKKNLDDAINKALNNK